MARTITPKQPTRAKAIKAPATTPAATTPPAPKPAEPAAKAPPAPYTLTERGKALTPRPGTARDAAWAVLVRHAGKPDGAAALKAEIATTPNCGAITGANLLGWARKQGLVV